MPNESSREANVMAGNWSWSHCPVCGQQVIGGRFLCGHEPSSTQARIESNHRPTETAGDAPKPKCGQFAGSMHPRLQMNYACVLDAGHEGECKPGGTCFAHGPYVGLSCPKWPECAEIAGRSAAAETVAAPPSPSDGPKTEHEPLEWGTNCPAAPDRGPHECAGDPRCKEKHVCLRCGALCLCEWCNMGYKRTQSSVSDRFVHANTCRGRVMCIDQPSRSREETVASDGFDSVERYKVVRTFPNGSVMAVDASDYDHLLSSHRKLQREQAAKQQSFEQWWKGYMPVRTMGTKEDHDRNFLECAWDAWHAALASAPVQGEAKVTK